MAIQYDNTKITKQYHYYKASIQCSYNKITIQYHYYKPAYNLAITKPACIEAITK